ncbi:hypothetical protein LK994_09120 [Ferruginibacter lapsinanis]|uniref:DUF7935 family protein n=1 Tax=Ferruginibacter lapsinanis TaxID=563172 RepID=UPI001E43D215|nr:hypothetical protein [Ferruginibacter lapsinanis]UEG48796.1 hypothetical protein LK994_09120 [Ferruginibacter lapsinanis]
MLLFEVSFQEVTGIAIVFIIGMIVYLLMELKTIRRELKAKQPAANNSLLPLQAYERLSLLTDRITLKNLVTRMHAAGYTAEELKAGLTQSIREEYEHNITQQIYVNPEVWKAVTNLKEQNIYIINQLATALPPQAPAVELSKLILEYSSGTNAELSSIVLDAIQFEVKKII